MWVYSVKPPVPHSKPLSWHCAARDKGSCRVVSPYSFTWWLAKLRGRTPFYQVASLAFCNLTPGTQVPTGIMTNHLAYATSWRKKSLLRQSGVCALTPLKEEGHDN